MSIEKNNNCVTFLWFDFNLHRVDSRPLSVSSSHSNVAFASSFSFSLLIRRTRFLFFPVADSQRYLKVEEAKKQAIHSSISEAYLTNGRGAFARPFPQSPESSHDEL